VSAIDAKGRAVPTADQLIRFEISGAGRLLGVGNGDPSSHESDKAPQRKLFNGMALCLLQATKKAGEIIITATGGGLQPARLTIKARPVLSSRDRIAAAAHL
jgi:beta-galactosidase